MVQNPTSYPGNLPARARWIPVRLLRLSTRRLERERAKILEPLGVSAVPGQSGIRAQACARLPSGRYPMERARYANSMSVNNLELTPCLPFVIFNTGIRGGNLGTSGPTKSQANRRLDTDRSAAPGNRRSVAAGWQNNHPRSQAFRPICGFHRCQYGQAATRRYRARGMGPYDDAVSACHSGRFYREPVRIQSSTTGSWGRAGGCRNRPRLQAGGD
jgi:hypothetical protein